MRLQIIVYWSVYKQIINLITLSGGLFVCLGFFVPCENFSHIRRRHHCRWRAANLNLCSAPTAIEQWGIFNIPHLQCTVTRDIRLYWNGHLRGPVTLAPNAERLAVEQPIPVYYDLGLSRLVFELPTFRLRGQHCATAAATSVIH